MRIAALLLACCCAAPADAATLKPFTTLSSGVVRLSDLWDGVEADKPLGPSPAPGQRITVPAPQLAAIARQFGVDWHPGSSGDRAVLERPGRPLGKDDVRGPLWEALLGAGAPRDAELELGVFTAPLLPTGVQPEITAQQVEFDKVSGRYAVLLDVAAEGVPNAQLRVTGRVQEMVDLPVPRRRMMPGDVIGPDDLEWARLKTATARGEVVRLPAQAVGQALKHALVPNQPILLADLGRPIVIQKGGAVTLSLESPGLQLTAQGVATEPGGVGERIRVLNPLSRITVQAEIIAPGQARVIPGTAQQSNNLVAIR
ncbi:MAG TPA: flagellar basal body P-ring formation chaperone FlgA [Acetobacteraceae bacterium]|nr:flagellar basal body P-ring formation chaperone FlgA [Acetobacteraceae bacterium]